MRRVSSTSSPAEHRRGIETRSKSSCDDCVRLPRTHPRLRAGAIAAAALLVAAGLIAVVVRGGSSSGEDICGNVVEFNGVPYEGISLQPPSTLVFGERLGEGVLLGCRDELDAPPSADERATLLRIDGVPTSVALGWAEDTSAFLLARGRCDLSTGWSGLERCLRETLVFRGRPYVATQLDEASSLERRPLAAAAVLRASGTDEREVAVAGLEGIDPALALALPRGNERIVYLADGHCYESGKDAILACLRGEGAS